MGLISVLEAMWDSDTGPGETHNSSGPTSFLGLRFDHQGPPLVAKPVDLDGVDPTVLSQGAI
jgi:hypothetical protein